MIQDRHVTYCEIEATLCISYTIIYKILHERREKDLFLLDPTWFEKSSKRCKSRLLQTNTHEMVERMQKCIDNEGEYFKK